MRWVILLGLLLFCLAEPAARFAGYGDPPLLIADPDIEYLGKPGVYDRFGKRVYINSLHMRSSEPPYDSNALRILVIGDSIMAGRNVDQGDLATSIAEQSLIEALDRPVWIGNVSAGSWGPGNQLAYVRKFGWANADMVIFVFNSDDVVDVPGDPIKHAKAPMFALHDFWLSEIMLRINNRFPSNSAGQMAWPESRGPNLVSALIREAKENAPSVTIVHHPRVGEGDNDNRAFIHHIAEVEKVPVFTPDLSPSDYYDGMHVTQSGIDKYAALIRDITIQMNRPFSFNENLARSK